MPPSDELALVLVDQSQDAQDFSRDQADVRLTNELHEGGRFRRFVKGIWKGNIAKDYYRQKYIQEARSEIEANQDILTHHDVTAEQRGRAMTATIQRFQSEYDESIHTAAGERRAELGTDSDIANGLKNLIRQYAEGNLGDEALLEERTRVIEAYREANGDELLGPGKVRIDNILTIAQSVKGAVEHGESLDRVMNSMKVIAGEARSGVRTEARYSKVDRVIEKLNRSKIGSLVGPEIIAASVTTAASLLRLGSHKVVGALAMTVAPGISAGLFAGLRENKRVKDERTQHAREMAMGNQFEEGAKRREQIEETRYLTASADELTSILRERFGDGVLDSDEALSRALAALGAVETRVSMSDARNIDLISYSSVAAIDEERFALDIARAEAKTILEQRLDATTRQRLGLDENASLQAMLEEQATLFQGCMEKDMSKKDKAFQKLKARRVAMATATGVLAGLTLGVMAQEGIASLSDTREGLVEQLWNAKDSPINGEQHQTLLYGLVHGDNSHTISVHHPPSNLYESQGLGKSGEISISSDHSLVHNPNGTLSLVDKSGHITVNQLAVNPDGSLPASTLDTLSSHGMTVENLSHTIDTVTNEQQTVSVADYIAEHPGQTTHITRDLWYDNNTPAPVFDKNELGLHWANGSKGPGLQLNGDFRLDTATMTSGGSYHGGQSVDWHDAAVQGNLKLAISATEGTQMHTFMLDVQPDGSITIPHDSVAAQFFSEENGEPVFTGKYAEVVQMTGRGTNGVEHVRPLAILVGAGRPDIQATVPVHHQEFVPNYKITTGGYNTSEQQVSFTEMAPVIPVIPRRSLEVLEAAPPDEPGSPTEGDPRPPAYYAGRGEISIDEALRLRQERSPRLNENPEASLRLDEELDFYHDLLERERGQAYINSLENDIADSTELSQLSDDIESIITIPVAAGTEANNIYKTLSLYAQQDQDSLDKNLVYLHVNWIDDMVNDPEKRSKIERTRQEIDRARKDFPHLRVATTETEYAREEVRNGIIGHVSRRMVDTLLMSLRRSVKSGNIQPDHDVLVVRNDADMNGIGRHYIKSMQDNMRENDTIDVFTGTTRFGVERYRDLPGFGIVTNIMQMGNVLGASGRYNKVHLGGANAGVRATTLAGVGGLGFGSWTGAGSDDVELGWRIAAARSGNVKEGIDHPRSGYGYNSGIKISTARKVLKRVGGAAIDTNGDRLEALYRNGGNVIDAWGDYDSNGGYQERPVALDGNGVESVRKDFKEVAERIRRNIEAIIVSNDDDTLSRSVLAFSFPNKSYYKFTRNDEGRVEFEFSRQGQAWLRNQILRDTRGRRDFYGDRAMRRLYGVAESRRARRPVPPRSPLVRSR